MHALSRISSVSREMREITIFVQRTGNGFIKGAFYGNPLSVVIRYFMLYHPDLMFFGSGWQHDKMRRTVCENHENCLI